MNKLMKSLLFSAVLLLTSQIQAGSLFTNNCCEIENDCCGCWEWGAWIDLMAVKPCAVETLFASTEINLNADDEIYTDHFIHPDFSFGFRLGVGAGPECSNWKTKLLFTHWENKSSGYASIVGSAEGNRLDPLIGDNSINLNSPSDSASTDTSLNYEYSLLDWIFSYDCCLCKGLGFQPYAGFRAVWIKENFSELNKDSRGIVYSATGDRSTAGFDLSAYGVVTGIQLSYNLCSSFNFYGSIGGSIVGGNNQFSDNSVSTGSSSAGIEKYQAKTCTPIYSWEGNFGVLYDTCICDTDLVVGLGYEVTRWFDIGQIFENENTSLHIQAVVFKIGAEF